MAGMVGMILGYGMLAGAMDGILGVGDDLGDGDGAVSTALGITGVGIMVGTLAGAGMLGVHLDIIIGVGIDITEITVSPTWEEDEALYSATTL
jgi:hypothetical protein